MPTTFLKTTSNNATGVGYNVIPVGMNGIQAVSTDDATYLDSVWADGSIGGVPGAGYDLPFAFTDTSAITALAGGGTVIVDSVRAHVKSSANGPGPSTAFHRYRIAGGPATTWYTAAWDGNPFNNSIWYPEANRISGLIPGITNLTQLATITVETGNVLYNHKINYIALEVVWHVDNPPAFTGATANTAQTVTVGAGLTAVVATDPNGDPITYSLQSGSLPTGITLNANGTFSGTTNTVGTFTANIRATAGTLFATTTLVVTVNAVNLPPVYTSAATNTAQTVTVGGGLLAVVATDPEGDTITYSLQSGTLPPGITLNANGTFSGATTTAGAYAPVIRATSTGGVATTTLNVTVNAPINQPPTFTGAVTNTTQTIGLGGTLVAVLATDPEFDTITYSLFGGALPTGITLNPNGTFSGTATAAGSYSATIRATATGGFASTTLATTVSGAVNQPPAFTSASTNTVQNINAGQTPTPLVAVDPDGDPITYSLAAGQLPPGVTLNPSGTFSGAPTASGTYTFTVIASATGGSATTVVTMVVSQGLQVIRGRANPCKPFVLRRTGTLQPGNQPVTIVATQPTWATHQVAQLKLSGKATVTGSPAGQMVEGSFSTIISPGPTTVTWTLDILVTPRNAPLNTAWVYSMSSPGPVQANLLTAHDHYCRDGWPQMLDSRHIYRDLFNVTPDQAEYIMDVVNGGFTFYDIIKFIKG